MRPAPVLTPVDPVLSIPDVCRVMKISESQFYELRAAGRFGSDLPALVEVQPAIDRKPRYRGAPFVEWLEESRQSQLRRRTLAAVR